MMRAALSVFMRSHSGMGSFACGCSPPRLSTRRMSESTKPGEISVQLAPIERRSPCSDSASARTANLLMAYGEPPGVGT